MFCILHFSFCINMVDVSIKKATVSDASWIAPLCHKQFQVAHEGAMLPEDLEYCVDMLFNEQSIKEDIEAPDNYYHIAVWGDEKLGCTKTSSVELNMGRNQKNALELTRVYVQPEYIGKGVGSELMRCVIDHSKVNGIQTLWLHVYENNTAAIDFYLKWGFQKMGKQDYPVRNSCPVGWVMRKQL
jgi:ribosomal protein S18 acetylase RimI-like enzyme